MPVSDFVAATSVGIVDGDAAARPRLRRGLAGRGGHERRDDRRRPLRRGAGHRRRAPFIEDDHATALMALAEAGHRELVAEQREALGRGRPDLKVVLASRNRGKLRETSLLPAWASSWSLASGARPASREDGATLEDNALAKARAGRRGDGPGRWPTIPGWRWTPWAGLPASFGALRWSGCHRHGQQREAAAGPCRVPAVAADGPVSLAMISAPPPYGDEFVAVTEARLEGVVARDLRGREAASHTTRCSSCRSTAGPLRTVGSGDRRRRACRGHALRPVLSAPASRRCGDRRSR